VKIGVEANWLACKTKWHPRPRPSLSFTAGRCQRCRDCDEELFNKGSIHVAFTDREG